VPNVTWLAEVLIAAGLPVTEVDGWETRGRGPMGDPVGFMWHHTAGPRADNPRAGPTPSLNIILNGRGGSHPVSGPLSHLYVSRAPMIYVVAAGRTNHAGAGNWQGITDGGSRFIGAEFENAGDGTDPWSKQIIEVGIGAASAICHHIGRDPGTWIIGHKEYALPHGRKIDPTLPMDEIRAIADVDQPDQPRPIPPTDPRFAMLRKGARGESVRILQGKLKILPPRAKLIVDGNFGSATERAVRAFQAAHKLKVDGLVGPKTWAALLA
jgi:N-acetyl-anhydromuramyl-L-alanine amidase AmpD